MITAILSLIAFSHPVSSVLPGLESSFNSLSIQCPSTGKVFCHGSTDPSETGVATATTTCSSGATITYQDAPITLMNCPTDRFDAQLLRTWTATDACGNSASCVQTIDILRQLWDMDIMPGSCPNTVNTLSGPSTVIVSVSGSATQDVHNLVPSSIGIWCDQCMAGPVAPVSTAFQDVSRPFSMTTECGCQTLQGDGITDLKITFNRAALVSGLHLAAMPSGTMMRLVVTGSTTDGCTFIALDCIQVLNPPDCNHNGIDDATDIASGHSHDYNADGIPDECESGVGDQGCSLGYWKNHLSAWGPTGYSPTADFDTIFGVNAFTPNRTLLGALTSGGGGIDNLGRQGVAALLDAAHPNVHYPLSVTQVIAIVHNAVVSGNAGSVASQLDTLNNLSCPLH